MPDAVVRQQHHLKRRSRGETVQRANDGDIELAHGLIKYSPFLDPQLGARRVELARLVEILPRAERLLARAGQHDRAHARRFLYRGQCLEEFIAHRHMPCVHHFGPVERNNLDRADPLNFYKFIQICPLCRPRRHGAVAN